jgi:hypothetical protein
MKVTDLLDGCQRDYENHTRLDPSLKKKDTVEMVLSILERIKEAATIVNKADESTRENLYYLVYNASIMIHTYCNALRKAYYSKEATQYLAFAILLIDNNLILTTARYLHWRIKNYMELASAYADIGAYKAANKVVSYGLQKVRNLVLTCLG